MKRAFTLIEIVITMLILGVVASVGVVSFKAVTDQARTTACKNEFALMQTAQESHYAVAYGYTTEADLVTKKFLAAPVKNYDVAPANLTGTAPGATAYAVALASGSTCPANPS